jgi:N-acetylglutamate synthase/N-acetylornithine aminotransferase
MTTISDPSPTASTVPVSAPVLPPVDRRSVIPAGFRAGGLAAGIKASGPAGSAVVVTTSGPAAAAAVFTPNTFAAAPSACRRRTCGHVGRTGGFGWAEAIVSTTG